MLNTEYVYEAADSAASSSCTVWSATSVKGRLCAKSVQSGHQPGG